MMLDMRRTFDEMVRGARRAGSRREDPRQPLLPDDLHVVLRHAGVHGDGEARPARRDGNWDLIVVDTPPSRLALDFLDAPQRMSKFLDGRMIRLLSAQTDTHRTLPHIRSMLSCGPGCSAKGSLRPRQPIRLRLSGGCPSTLWDCSRRRRNRRRSSPIPRRRLMRARSIVCWRRHITAKSGPATGSISPAMPTATATSRTAFASTPGAIATG